VAENDSTGGEASEIEWGGMGSREGLKARNEFVCLTNGCMVWVEFSDGAFKTEAISDRILRANPLTLLDQGSTLKVL